MFEYPTLDALSVGSIRKGENVEIVESDSTDDFYKVCNAYGVEGFCKKELIQTNV